MKSISSASGLGSSGIAVIGVSVVPTTAWSCHGMANITRPSRVCGTMMAVSPGEEPLGEHDVHALARRDHRRRGGIVHAAHVVAEGAGGVDHAPRAETRARARLLVAEDDTPLT